MNHIVRASLVALGLVLGATASVMAAGGGGGGSGGSGGTGGGSGGKPTDMRTCERGLIWDAQTRTCVKRSSAVDDATLTDYAFVLAEAKRFDEALEVLDAVRDQTNARVLNYRGYATRKLGRTEEGIKYYLASVAADPTYVQVREYLGEAYVTLGKLDLAREQLARIEHLCGNRTCEEYEDLAKAIDAGKVVD